VGDVRRKDVGEILKATERAAELTRQLLAFGRRQVLRLEPMNLNTVVEDMMKIVRRLIADDITIDVALESGPWTIRADPGQLEQVILNLALNARDAMAAGGGTLRISTRNDEGSHATGRNTGTVRHVVLEVSDTGTGMSEHTRERIFEPFFTTKESGDRAGLGLATVYGIVTQSGGQISVHSELGEGSTFTIRLPVSSSLGAGARSPGATARRSASGNVVLMAEDNEGVRALTVRILADAGYRVVEACDGVDALETLATLEEPVDLLISDVMMPRMNGSELATRFEEEQPGTPILLMSGYMDDDTVRRAFGDPDSVLQKPFTPEALLTRVRSLIGVAR
jgi:CheY-like chemotaxis protein